MPNGGRLLWRQQAERLSLSYAYFSPLEMTISCRAGYPGKKISLQFYAFCYGHIVAGSSISHTQLLAFKFVCPDVKFRSNQSSFIARRLTRTDRAGPHPHPETQRGRSLL